MNRRSFLTSTLAGAVLAAGARVGRAATARGPRYIVLITPHGGLDSIFTTNPRVASEVAAGIDVPYAASQIREVGGRRVGPHLAALGAHWARFACVQNVAVETASHVTGAAQILRVRNNVVTAMPSWTEIVGRHRFGQPLGAIKVGSSADYYTSHELEVQDNSLFEEIQKYSVDEQQMMARSVAAEAKRARKLGVSDAIVDRLEGCAALYDVAGRLPAFRPDPWQPEEELYGPSFKRTLWLLENDVTRAVSLVPDGDWDSHFDNERRQRELSLPFFSALGRFMSELGVRKNRHGLLRDNTLVVIASEMGRLPYLNRRSGKDHLPETPFLVSGPGVRAGASFGEVGRQMEALPFDLRTGKLTSSGRRPRLDDMGTTLLRLAGVEPEVYGYHGEVLDCLFA